MLVAGLAILVALGALVALEVPAWLSASAAGALAGRTGAECSVESVSLGIGETTLRGVVLRWPNRVVGLRVVHVDAGAIALALEGGSAVHAVRVDGGDVELTIGAADASRAEADTSAGPGLGWPRVELAGVRVGVADAGGSLVSVESLDGWVDRGRAELTLADIRVGDAAEIVSLELEGDLATRALERVTTHGGRLLVGQGEGNPWPALRARLRGEPLAVVEAHETEGEDEAPPPDDPPASAERASSLLDLRRYFAADAEVLVHDLAIEEARCETDCTLLADLEVTVRGTDEEHVITTGSGTPRGGGRVHWDLDTVPAELRATGDVALDGLSLATLLPVLPSLPLHRPEDTRISGALSLRGRGMRVEAEGRLDVTELAVEHARIASAPIRHIDVAMVGAAAFDPDARRLELTELRVSAGRASVTTTGAIEWAPDHYLFDLVTTLPPTSCNDAVSGIPRDILAEVAGFSWSGTLGGSLRVRVDSRELERTVLEIRVADRCRFETVPAMADLSRFHAPFVHTVEEPDGTVFEMETGPGSDAWAPITAMSPFLLQAVLGHEDGGFFTHSGFSPYAIRLALVRNLREGRYVLGASTITMQLVKNVFLHRQKTLARKVQEVLLTWWIESSMEKAAILELYLNVIEFAPGVYGIRNATRHYFGIEPSALSPAQAAYLAMILPSPKRFHTHYEARALPPGWVNRLGAFITLLGERGRFDAAAVTEGLAEASAFRFHREGDPTPEPRTFLGHAAPVPIEGLGDEGAADEAWVEATDERWDEPATADDGW